MPHVRRVVDYYNSIKEFHNELLLNCKEFILKIDPYLFDQERFIMVFTYQKFIEK